MQSHIEAIVVGIVSMAVNIVEVGRTLFEELFHGTARYHTAHRNLHLDYFVSHNWDI